MRDELVAIDLETTGLDVANDEIIEVGAVRLKNGEVIDEYSTMVTTDRPIPPNVTFITGIKQEDLEGAPTIEMVLPQITAFVGKAPVIAHNISLDMGMLQDRHGILMDNIRVDTYDLASVLMPRAPRYNLNSLTHQVGITLEQAHRALDDARATALLYWALWQKALRLPRWLLREIGESAQELKWDAGAVFAAALAAGGVEGEGFQHEPLNESIAQQEPLAPKSKREPLNVRSITNLIEPDGQLSQNIPNFEHRSQQTRMIQAITEAFNNSSHLMIEAGTGAGKSLAYLIPSVMWSVANNERVVVSTNTLNLQDQLINKDIPLLEAGLEADFTASVMKGRSNYLCPRRLEAIRRRKPNTQEELRTLAKILVWRLESDSGDRNEVSLRGPVENNIWQRLSAADEGCSLHRCHTTMKGVCPFYKARKAAERANILIVNHALLIADANAENNVLPDYRYLVVDEAHHLEDAITHGMSLHLDSTMILRRLADLGGPSRGFLGEVLATARDHIPGEETAKLERFIQIIGEATTIMEVHVKRLFKSLNRFLMDVSDRRPSDYMTTLRIERQHREKASFAQVQNRWNALDEFFEVTGQAMQRLTKALNKIEKYNVPGLSDLISSADTAAHYLAEMRTNLHKLLMEPDPNLIYWLTLSQGNTEPVIHAAPLHVGPMVDEHLWRSKESIILTSATLQTHDGFNYLKERLYGESVDTLEVGSPFDYQLSTLLYIPADIPQPGDRTNYQKAVERGITELAESLDGRVMVLFTSYTQLRQTSKAITPQLERNNITVYDQSDGSSRESLLEGFSETDKAVLMGTKSFWEGVDIPGESLSALVITRLPFAVPTDPIFSSRSDTYSNSFGEYALPEAIIRFRQGFGRLIRTATDRGVVAIFDSRILSKRYGLNFLEVLPDCTVREGSLDELPGYAAQWLRID